MRQPLTKFAARSLGAVLVAALVLGVPAPEARADEPCQSPYIQRITGEEHFVYVWTLGVVWVVYMMWSRTYLHAHWASDVVAGLLEGIAVACLVWSAMQALRIRRQMSTSASSPEPDA